MVVRISNICGSMFQKEYTFGPIILIWCMTIKYTIYLFNCALDMCRCTLHEWVDPYIHIPIPLTGHVGFVLHSTTVATLSPPVMVLYGYSDATAAVHAVAEKYPHSTLSGTPHLK